MRNWLLRSPSGGSVFLMNQLAKPAAIPSATLRTRTLAATRRRWTAHHHAAHLAEGGHQWPQQRQKGRQHGPQQRQQRQQKQERQERRERQERHCRQVRGHPASDRQRRAAPPPWLCKGTLRSLRMVRMQSTDAEISFALFEDCLLEVYAGKPMLPLLDGRTDGFDAQALLPTRDSSSNTFGKKSLLVARGTPAAHACLQADAAQTDWLSAHPPHHTAGGSADGGTSATNEQCGAAAAAAAALAPPCRFYV
jgi:hypothetical protein